MNRQISRFSIATLLYHKVSNRKHYDRKTFALPVSNKEVAQWDACALLKQFI